MIATAWTHTTKLPKNKLTKAQWDIVCAMKNNAVLCNELKDGKPHPYWADGRKNPRLSQRTVDKLIQHEWIKPVRNLLGGIQNYELT